MSIVNPIALFGLLALLLPLILHFIKKTEAREVEWAATRFLIQKDSHAVRRHSIAEWLLLLARFGAIIGLVCALARPVGHVLAAFRSPATAVLILLDRSAEMGGRSEEGEDALKVALKEVVAALQPYPNSTQFYLIDSASLEVLPIIDVESIPLLSQTELTDTPCSLPLLIEAGLAFLAEEGGAAAELWVVSSALKGVWQDTNSTWGKFPQSVPEGMKVRVQHFTPPERSLDLRLSVSSAELKAGLAHLTLNITGGQSESVKVEILKQGQVIQKSIQLISGRVDYPVSFPYEGEEGGGEVRILEDGNERNNRAFFAFGAQSDLQTVVIARESESVLVRNLVKASALASRPYQKASVITPEDALLMDLSSYDLLIWSGEVESVALREVIEQYVKAGGKAILFPPSQVEQAAALGSKGYFREVQTAEEGEYYTVKDWNKREAGWRDARSGESLPLGRLQAVQVAALHELKGTVLAHWNTGQPLLVREYIGEGVLYAMTTRPYYSWSNMENLGLHIVFIQRMLEECAVQQGGGSMKTLKSGGGAALSRVEEGVAYIRPPFSRSGSLSRGEIEELLVASGLVMDDAPLNTKAEWQPLLLYAALVFLFLEALLQSRVRDGAGRETREKEVMYG